ncbi:histidine phosphatase family protein [Noviherbaspirillum sp. ST9]|uniref:histidine phosphatase family protein n=1 Tax=Noviherbaspirillum sp. ST9 TaxID=3401606 RepID=UPI003B58766F
MRLYLIRHARPVVQEGVCYGSTDLGVDEGHQRQVLSQLLPVLPAGAAVFSSPFKRCRSLAEEVACALGAEPVFDARLVEMNFGAWEMQAWNSIPRAEIDAWAADLLRYRPGNGECLLDVAGRVKSFHEALCARRTGSAVVIAHAGTIRLLHAATQAATPEEMASMAAATPNSIAYGELTTIDYQTDNKRRG